MEDINQLAQSLGVKFPNMAHSGMDSPKIDVSQMNETNAFYKPSYPSSGQCPNCGYCPSCGRSRDWPKPTWTCYAGSVTQLTQYPLTA